ncbi:Aste57867_7414 [Aphanomyces stellatus]|uniref:Aste57867_7414 protein n=1 Tax=Aphanomyces stellatus TaxID=120398 RepID=A0A485KIA0_9STRA|nr:hypothetical protein As57867_007388 [Aphanomyces stellatus]VFT84328.1 Aste57867_7414 [Aphanomyces stellatus]
MSTNTSIRLVRLYHESTTVVRVSLWLLHLLGHRFPYVVVVDTGLDYLYVVPHDLIFQRPDDRGRATTHSLGQATGYLGLHRRQQPMTLTCFHVTTSALHHTHLSHHDYLAHFTGADHHRTLLKLTLTTLGALINASKVDSNMQVMAADSSNQTTTARLVVIVVGNRFGMKFKPLGSMDVWPTFAFAQALRYLTGITLWYSTCPT